MTEPGPYKEEHPPGKWSSGAAIGFGTSFAVGMAFFGLGGHWLDERYGREPLFTLLGLFLGLFYGGWELWKLTTASNRKPANDVDQRNGGNER